MNMKKNGFAAFLRRRQYVIAGAIVVAAAVGTTVLYSNSQEKERRQLEAELAEENSEPENMVAEKSSEPENIVAEENAVAAEDTEQTAEAAAVIPPESSAETDIANTGEVPENLADTGAAGAAGVSEEKPAEKEPKSTETAAGKTALHFSPENGILWPMEGNVILNYSMDATVYFATLDQYKYNPAVIIEGEVNDKVYSVAKGKVTSIENSEVTGCTITVDMGDGYQAIYGQLKEPSFEVGDYVESGHVMGYIAEPSKYFSVEGSNLYFALQKDGEPMNPVEFFE